MVIKISIIKDFSHSAINIVSTMLMSKETLSNKINKLGFSFLEGLWEQ